MDKRLQIVERLYRTGEDGQSPEHPIGSGEEDDLRREYQAMSQAKFWMDHRRPQRPDAATIERIVAAAAKATAGDVPRGVPGETRVLRLLRGAPLRVAVAAAVAMIAVSIGLWRAGDGPDAEQVATQEMEQASRARKDAGEPAASEVGVVNREKAELADEAIAELDAVRQGRASALDTDSAVYGRLQNEPAAVLATTVSSELPEWEYPDELVRIKQRIEQLKARQSDLGWDKPLVPLEMMPRGGAADATIRQVGAKQEQ